MKFFLLIKKTVKIVSINSVILIILLTIIDSFFDTSPSDYVKCNVLLKEYTPFKKEHLLLIDLVKEVPSDSTYIYDMVHLNTHWSELAANIVAEQLQNTYYSSQN